MYVDLIPGHICEIDLLVVTSHCLVPGVFLQSYGPVQLFYQLLCDGMMVTREVDTVDVNVDVVEPMCCLGCSVRGGYHLLRLVS